MSVDALFGPLLWFVGDLARHDLGLLGLAVLGFLIAAAEVGYRIGRLASRRSYAEGASSVGFVTGGMLALLAFLLGVSLSMADSRFEARRASVLNEANAIGTAWLRAQVVGGEQGAAIQALLRDYAPLRLEAIQASGSSVDDEGFAARAGVLQAAMWAAASEVARREPTPVNALLLASLNEVFDLSLTNRRNFTGGVPVYVLRLLLVASVLSVGAMGYHFGLGGKRHFIVSLLFLLLWTASMMLIVDIDQPRKGNITVDDRPFRWTIEGFEPPTSPR